MSDVHTPNTSPDTPGNPALERALQSLYGSGPRMPSELDSRILADARQALDRRRPMRLTIGRSMLALAATLALAASLALWFLPRAAVHPSARAGSLAKGDIDGDGHVDIVDAMVLATALKSPSTGLQARDINGDGKIDQADVDALGLLAVRLDGGGT